MSNLYSDIQEYLELSNEQLNYVLAAWCSYRSADYGLVDMLVDQVKSMNGHDKKPYFKKAAEDFPWIRKYQHHVKAITVASCKHQTLNHPDLVKQYLVMNEHIKLDVLLDTLEENKPDSTSKSNIHN